MLLLYILNLLNLFIFLQLKMQLNTWQLVKEYWLGK